MTESKVAASIKKAAKEMEAADAERQDIDKEVKKKREESKRRKQEANEKLRKELGTLLLEIDNGEGSFAGFKNRTVGDLLDAVFGREPGADARGLEPEAVPLSGSAGTESSQPHGTDSGSEGGYSNDVHQSPGWV